MVVRYDNRRHDRQSQGEWKMPEERNVVYTAHEGRDADILIMQLSRAGIEAARVLCREPGQAAHWQVGVSPRDEYHAREIVRQFEQDRPDLAPRSVDGGQEVGAEILENDDSLHSPTIVYSAGSLQEAHFLKNLLVESGINALVGNEFLQRGSGVDLVGLPTAATVMVAAKDAEAARGLALEFDRRTAVLADPQVVYSAKSLPEARAVKDALVAAGISAAVGDETMHAGTNVSVFGIPEAIPVIAAGRDVDAARQIVESGIDFQAVSSEATSDSESGESVVEAPAPWPRCPECDTRRTTRCPICPASGTDFEQVDPEFAGPLGLPGHVADASGVCGSSCSCGQEPQAVEVEASESPGTATCPPRLALMCPTCDEPFVAEFPRRCEWCGHEFADGYEVEDHVDGEPIPVQAMIVILALVILFLVACGYFACLV
jgi:hypothetical protein